jgi:uncharacterized protein
MSIESVGVRSVDHVGRGWAFPLDLTAAGGFRIVSGGAEIDASISMILGTAPGERVLRPDFGCAMWAQTFAPLNQSTVGLVEQSVREALDRWEPRIDVESVKGEADRDNDRVLVSVTYRVRATNDHRNLVHPFYVIPQEENPV